VTVKVKQICAGENGKIARPAKLVALIQCFHHAASTPDDLQRMGEKPWYRAAVLPATAR